MIICKPYDDSIRKLIYYLYLCCLVIGAICGIIGIILYIASDYSAVWCEKDDGDGITNFEYYKDDFGWVDMKGCEDTYRNIMIITIVTYCLVIIPC